MQLKTKIIPGIYSYALAIMVFMLSIMPIHAQDNPTYTNTVFNKGETIKGKEWVKFKYGCIMTTAGGTVKTIIDPTYSSNEYVPVNHSQMGNYNYIYK